MIKTLKEKKLLFPASILVILMLALLLTIFKQPDDFISASAIRSNDWGVSYQTKGETPLGNADADFLAQYDSFFSGDDDEKVIYLTFDAGYENGNTEKILDALKAHDVKAAFFIVGQVLKTNPEIVQRIAEEGHIVGNHTFNHPDMSSISDVESFQAELEMLETRYAEVTGFTMPKYYRPPRGKFNEDNLKNAQSLGYQTVFWSVAYVDWYVDRQPSPGEAFETLLPRTHPGAIVLLHTTSKTNADILDELLTRWETLGYRFGSLDEISPQNVSVAF